jgi:hypothetical protein
VKINTASPTANGKIWISKYDINGVLQVGPIQVDNNQGSLITRNEVAVAVDGAGNVITTWWEGKSDGSQPETIHLQRLNNSLGLVGSETQVNQPPLGPPGGPRAARPGVATDSSNNFVVSWQGDENDGSDNTWKLFSRTFNSSGTSLKNDFRIDLAPRTAAARAERLARSSQGGKFAYVWRDNRAGHYDVYTRVVKSLQ